MIYDEGGGQVVGMAMVCKCTSRTRKIHFKEFVISFSFSVNRNILNKTLGIKSLAFFLVDMCVHMLSPSSSVQLFVTPWTVAHQVHLSMGFF